jgi:hypothetical protein
MKLREVPGVHQVRKVCSRPRSFTSVRLSTGLDSSLASEVRFTELRVQQNALMHAPSIVTVAAIPCLSRFASGLGWSGRC